MAVLVLAFLGQWGCFKALGQGVHGRAAALFMGSGAVQGARASEACVALELSLSWTTLRSQGARHCLGPEFDLDPTWMPKWLGQ